MKFSPRDISLFVSSTLRHLQSASSKVTVAPEGDGELTPPADDSATTLSPAVSPQSDGAPLSDAPQCTVGLPAATRRKRKNSLLTDVRLARNMWTHTEYRGYGKESSTEHENRVTWGFTYMNRRHFVEFSQTGEFGQVHAISIDERMVEKVEVDPSLGWGPASYRIFLSGDSSDDVSDAEPPTPDEEPPGESGKPNGNPTNSSKLSQNISNIRFPCVIQLSVDKRGQTRFSFSIDGVPFEAARAHWVLEHLRTFKPNPEVWRQLEEKTDSSGVNTLDEEHHRTWRFPYKGHYHQVTFHHRVYNCQWDITVDGMQVDLYKMTENVVIPDPSVQSTAGRGVAIRFLVAGLPCKVVINKKDFFYIYALSIDGVPYRVYTELYDALVTKRGDLHDEHALAAAAASASVAFDHSEAPSPSSLTGNSHPLSQRASMEPTALAPALTSSVLSEFSTAPSNDVPAASAIPTHQMGADHSFKFGLSPAMSASSSLSPLQSSFLSPVDGTTRSPVISYAAAAKTASIGANGIQDGISDALSPILNGNPGLGVTLSPPMRAMNIRDAVYE